MYLYFKVQNSETERIFIRNLFILDKQVHGLWTPGEEMAFTAQTKIKSQSQIFRYGRRICCLPHRPKISNFFDLCLHWVSVVREQVQAASCCIPPAFNLLIIYYYTPVTYYMLLWQVFLRFLVHNCFRCLPWSNAARKEHFDLKLYEVRQCST